MSSMRWLRWVLVGLGVVLGLVLLAAGDSLIGGLILVMAVARAALLIGMQQRRSRWRQVRSERQGRGQGPSRPW